MNDKISAAVQALGFCCPFAYFCNRREKYGDRKKQARELSISIHAIEYNRRNFHNGTLTCTKVSICQHAVKPEEKK